MGQSSNRQAYTRLAGAETLSRYVNTSLSTTGITVDLLGATGGVDRVINLIVQGDPVMMAYGDNVPTFENIDGYYLDGFQGHISCPGSSDKISFVSTGTSSIIVLEK